MHSFVRSFLVVTLLAGAAQAGPVRTFHLTTYKDFDEGEAKGTLLTSLGDVLPGLDAQRGDLGELLAWCALRVDKTLYVGTGDQGGLWAVRDHDKPKKVATLDGVLVSALETNKAGTLFAAVTPGGRIFSVDKLGDKAPRVRELVKLDSEHVWALSYDDAKKTLYAATGPSGKLYAIDVASLDKAKAKVLWSSGEKHLLSLARTDDGALLVGSADQAILYRVHPNGSAADVRVVHDFDGEELRAIVRDKGATYVAINDFKGQGLNGLVAQLASKSARPPVQAASGTSSAPPMGSPASRERKGKGAVYRIDDDGRVEQLHALADGYFTALARDGDGTLWAAAGSNGRVYQLRGDRTVATALDLPERQVLFVELGADPILGTGDAGAIYHLSPATKEALYVSKALDAQFFARWGKVRYGGTGVEIFTRSGNTQKPDATWTGWQALATVETRGELGAGRVQSASGRFIQLRARLKDAKAVLRDVAIYYQPQNQRPRVTEIVVGDDPVTTHRLTALSKSPRSHSASVRVRWKADSGGDDDELVYRLSFREESEPAWRPLGGPEPLTKTELDWNTDGLPDGTYVVRVVASDERANAKEEALEHSLVSAPFLVDNKKPEVGPIEVISLPGAKADAPIANGRAKDAASPIVEMAYSLDGGDWQALAPKDGVFDDLEEAFSVKLPSGLVPGTHTIAVRAVDSADNIGAAQVNFRVK